MITLATRWGDLNLECLEVHDFSGNADRFIWSERPESMEPGQIIFSNVVKPNRLRCQYCGRIALTERPTCEGCGAVLPWEMSYEE